MTDPVQICGELEKLQADGVEFDRLLMAAVERLHVSDARFRWTGLYELGSEGTLLLGPFLGSKTPGVPACSVLIRDLDHIFGQIDIDSHESAAFDDATVRCIEQVADCLAGAYRLRRMLCPS